MKKLLAAVVALGLMTVPALAVDLGQTLHDQDKMMAPDGLHKDAGLSCGEVKGYPCLTLGAALYHALLGAYPDEQSLSGEEKNKRGRLAIKIDEAAEKKQPIDFSAEDTAKLKMLIGKLYAPIIVVQVYSLLDPTEK